MHWLSRRNSINHFPSLGHQLVCISAGDLDLSIRALGLFQLIAWLRRLQTLSFPSTSKCPPTFGRHSAGLVARGLLRFSAATRAASGLAEFFIGLSGRVQSPVKTLDRLADLVPLPVG